MTCECKCYSILSCRPCQEFQDTDLVKLQKNNVSVGYQGHLRFWGLMYRNVEKWVLVFVKRPRVAVPYSFSHKKINAALTVTTMPSFTSSRSSFHYLKWMKRCPCCLVARPHGSKHSFLEIYNLLGGATPTSLLWVE